MSLLMDALRKAEESKKQAEQEKEATSSGEVIAPAGELISSEPSVDVESRGQDRLAEKNNSEPEPSKLLVSEESLANADVQIDFEPPGAATASVLEESSESSADISASPSSLERESFELEPRLPTTARAQSYTADQLQISVPAGGDSSAEPEQMPSDDSDEDYTSISSFLSSATLDQAVSIASAELEKQKPDTAAGRKADTAKKAVAAAPFAEAEPVVESIVDRTADSRKSAKSVFAAKKLSHKNNRSLLISVAGIAVLLVIGLGVYLTASLAPSGGISVGTDSFPVSQSFENSSSISDLVAQEESSALRAVTEDASLDSAAPASPQSDTLFGGNAGAAAVAAVVAGNAAVIISDQPVGLENANPIPVEGLGLDQQASPEAFTDNATPAPVSLSNVVDDESADEVFVIGDLDVGVASAVSPSSSSSSLPSSLPNSSPSSLPGSSPNSSSISAPSTLSSLASRAGLIVADTLTTNNGSSRIDGGGTLGSTSNVVSPVVPAASELISFRRTSQQQAIVPSLTEGFRAYQNGDLDLARDLYEQTLLDTPENIDALLGLAAIASSDQELSSAMGLYLRVLGLDPSNTSAKTAIRSLAPLGTPAEQERELRKLDAQSPNVASLAFALGSFYASQSRWPDAQRYFFKALRLAKLNSQNGSAISPDYAFNLAVSLERLNQAGPALSFYEEAVALATRFPSNFDLSIVKARIENLSRTYSP